MHRYLTESILARLGQKIIILSGPRQVGKTFFSKQLSPAYTYYSFDNAKDRRIFRSQEWNDTPPLVIFDELHKMKKWKLWLKGLYDDGRFSRQHVIVTGSARLNYLQKVGDSLAGRLFGFRLYPIDLKELARNKVSESDLQKLLTRGGFPEPFLSKEESYHKLWRKNHLDIILKQDLFAVDMVKDIIKIEMLVDLLAERVGSTISANSLAENLDTSDKTITRWLRILEDLYVIFRVPPFSKNIARGIKKASKYYFYDTGRVEGDLGCKLENLVALSLKKELDFLEDTQGERTSLSFLRTKTGAELDFLLQIKGYPAQLIEIKTSDGEVSKHFNTFSVYFPGALKKQWVLNLDRPYRSKTDVRVEALYEGLKNFQAIT